MRTKTMFIMAVIATLALCFAVSQPAIASDEEDVLQVPMNWAKAFSTSDFELMSSLYWHSPKVSEFGPATGYPFLYQGWDLLGKEWESNTSIPAGELKFTVHNPQVVLLGKDAAVTAVYQTAVDTDPETGQQDIVQIRQTLVVQKINGKWLIVHHHSSILPVD